MSQPVPLHQWFNADWEELLSIDWSKGSISGGPEVNFVHQPSLEAEFRAAVRRQPTVDLHLGWELAGFAERDGHVEVELLEAEGSQTRTLRTRYLVGLAAADDAAPGDRVADVESKLLAFLDAHDAAGMVTRPGFYVFGGAAEARGLPALADRLLAALAENSVRVPEGADVAA